MFLCRYIPLDRHACMLNRSDMASAVAQLYLQHELFKFTVPLALCDKTSVPHTFASIQWLYGVNL